MNGLGSLPHVDSTDCFYESSLEPSQSLRSPLSQLDLLDLTILAAQMSSEKQNGTVVDDRSDDSLERVPSGKMDVVEITQANPYFEINFIGTYLAICLGALASYGGFVMPATSLTLINLDIGPSPNIYWVALAWTLCLSIGYTLVGRLSDIFGRRWFFTGASLLATIGCIVASTSNTVNQLIGANVLIGLAASGQLSFNYTIGELVPMKHRFISLAAVFVFAIPFSGFGPYISRLFIVHTGPGWRWDYYANIITNGLSTLLYFFFYFPPDFDTLHKKRRTRMQEIKELDYVGIFLFVAGLLLFLLGLSWGGSVHPWTSAQTLAPLLIGFVICVVFVFYECYVPLKRPLIPMHLFNDLEYVVLTIITCVGGMLYYSLNVIYPVTVATLYTTDVVRQGLLSCAIGGGVGLGQVLGSALATVGGFIKWKLVFCVIATTAFTAALASARTEMMGSALATLAAIFIGALESLAVSMITVVIKDQSELGAGGGTFGSLRSVSGVVATAVFTSVLSNKVTGYTTTIVVPAVLMAGLPASSVEPLLAALQTGEQSAVLAVPGITEEIVGVAVATTQESYAKAFNVVYLSSLAFGLTAVIASFWTPNIESRLNNDVVRRLGNRHSSKKSHADTSPNGGSDKV